MWNSTTVQMAVRSTPVRLNVKCVIFNLYFYSQQPHFYSLESKWCCLNVHQQHIRKDCWDIWLSVCVFLPQGRRVWSMTGVNTSSWRTSSAWSSRKRWSGSSRNSAWPASRIWRKKPTDRKRRTCRIRSQAKWELLYTRAGTNDYFGNRVIRRFILMINQVIGFFKLKITILLKIDLSL